MSIHRKQHTPARAGRSGRSVVRAAALATLGVAAFGAADARAANVQWNVASGNWADAANWNPNTAVPIETDVAILDFAGGGVATVNTNLANDVLTLKVQNNNTLSIEAGGDLRSVAAVAVNVDPLQAIRIGEGSAGNATVTDGTLYNTFTEPSGNMAADIYVGVTAGGIGTFTQNGAASLVYARDMRVGSESGTGNYTLNGGTLQTNWTKAGMFGGTGTITVNGGTILANLTTGARLQVSDGAGSTGTVNLFSGTIDTTGQVNIGVGSTSGANIGVGTGTMTHTGGLLVASDTVAVGRGGSSLAENRGTGTYTLGVDNTSTAAIDVNSDAAATNGYMVVGMNGGHGTFTMNGGSVATDHGFFVGYNDQGNVNNRSNGIVDLNAGAITTGGIFAVGYAAATGVMTMDGGTITSTGVGGVGYDDRTNTARATLSIGTLDHHAGTINANGGFVVGRGAGTGTYNIDGTAILNAGTAGVGDLVVGGPGDNTSATGARQGTINVAGTAAITVAGGLRMGDDRGKGFMTMTGGTLTAAGNSIIGISGTAAKPGTGSLTLDGATASASIGGTLNVADASNTSGVVTVTNGNLSVTGNSAFGAGGTGTGNLTVNGGNATFGGNLTSGDSGQSTGLINVSSGSLNVAGQLIAGRQTTVSGVITISGTGVVNAGSVGVRTGTGSVAATDFNVTGGTLNVTGNVTNNSTFDYTGGSATVGGAILGTGTTSVAAGLDLAVDSVTQGEINVDGKITVRPDSTATGVSRIGTITLGAAGKLDLKDNKLITPTALGTWGGSAYTDLSGLVDLGRGDASNAQWDGVRGIVTSDTRAVNNNDLVSIGTANVAALKNIAATDTATFAGQTVLGSDSIAMVTWGGDANLDGKINIDDYGQIDFNVASSGSVFGWFNGDFNYDGKINIDDYGIIDFNVSAQDSIFPTAGGAGGGGLDGVAAVPEPASVGAIALAAGAALLRRRRRAN